MWTLDNRVKAPQKVPDWTQFHPELTSRPLVPQPMFMGLVAAAIQHAHPDVEPSQITDRWLPPTLPTQAVEA